MVWLKLEAVIGIEIEVKAGDSLYGGREGTDAQNQGTWILRGSL